MQRTLVGTDVLRPSAGIRAKVRQACFDCRVAFGKPRGLQLHHDRTAHSVVIKGHMLLGQSSRVLADGFAKMNPDQPFSAFGVSRRSAQRIRAEGFTQNFGDGPRFKD